MLPLFGNPEYVDASVFVVVVNLDEVVIFVKIRVVFVVVDFRIRSSMRAENEAIVPIAARVKNIVLVRILDFALMLIAFCCIVGAVHFLSVSIWNSSLVIIVLSLCIIKIVVSMFTLKYFTILFNSKQI